MGVSAARRKCVKPASVKTARSLPSPAWAPSPSPTSCDSELGVQIDAEESDAMTFALRPLARRPRWADALQMSASIEDLNLLATTENALKRLGVITEIKPLVHELTSAGMYISDVILHNFLREVGES